MKTSICVQPRNNAAYYCHLYYCLTTTSTWQNTNFIQANRTPKFHIKNIILFHENALFYRTIFIQRKTDSNTLKKFEALYLQSWLLILQISCIWASNKDTWRLSKCGWCSHQAIRVHTWLDNQNFLF